MLNDCNVIKTHNEYSRATFFTYFFIGEWRVLKQLQALIHLKLFCVRKAVQRLELIHVSKIGPQKIVSVNLNVR